MCYGMDGSVFNKDEQKLILALIRDYDFVRAADFVCAFVVVWSTSLKAWLSKLIW